MLPCLVFLNELSYNCEESTEADELAPIVIETLRGLRAIQNIRRDLIVAGQSPISKIAIGNGRHSIASLLSGDAYKDHWRFIIGLDQTSPGASSWQFAKPHELQDVKFQGQQAFGMLWAIVTGSLIVSLGLSPDWKNSGVAAQLEEMADSGDISTKEIIIANVSNPNHVTEHQRLIFNYGRNESASSIVCQHNEFVARIYFFDHNPPHIHICSPADPSKTLATFAIQTDDILNGELSGPLQRIVREWVSAHREQLVENWDLCRTGRRPFLIE